jgi:hypothetical protein
MVSPQEEQVLLVEDLAEEWAEFGAIAELERLLEAILP